MPAKDIFHDAVKNALIKENWTITDDPLYLEFGGVDMYVDLGAEKLIGAEKEGKQIAVEIKSFLRQSLISEFHNALGQFINYRTVLRRNQPGRTLYLAVSEDAYESFFTLIFTQVVVEENEIKLIVYDAKKEVIVQWKN
ncbi:MULTISPECIES: XisH family protein [Okeania]|uniref:Fatty-acid oxidation protein subunit alpha n=1 Tax=Okeania hirsuta TaxID=1458930 RepID=A0A3N6NFH0_9CYAN|nr:MULTISPECIES: XisH family protein [Okeania]NET17446.1 fatty-acid oxidation protein subunit alpha [Okeania sp. SIO1H6]NES75879.1 fatty-acid oxidation protein subunit alpha [Okeania sp. SIO1H4]NES90453.1 fatty-acid oxidation protein subunit alpha [Okeania sp. SIO2B9]NET18989.1 fatty-acid oxidation protein subunit alpha [Okeania sp. SIO1H5]NET77997.1 fatty-acid oxidation protein subunit alpha [Okeania sp. SIO1F9]